jgi:hypothetical protein
MGKDNIQHLIEKYRVKIFTRSFSPELYTYSRGLFHEDIPIVRLTDQTADGYFFTMLEDTDCDIAVNIDEDAFITDWAPIIELIEYVVEHHIANAATPDAGPGCPRHHNPIITNPFFNVLNLKLIRTKYTTPREIQKFSYEAHREELTAKFPQALLGTLEYDLDCIDFEPYYPFFFWVAYHFETLYLPAVRHADGFSSILYDNQGRPFCLHSWFARKFKVQKFHTQRIFNLINEAYTARQMQVPTFTAEQRIGHIGELAVRYARKVVSRVMNWPHKWHLWYLRYQRKKHKE